MDVGKRMNVGEEAVRLGRLGLDVLNCKRRDGKGSSELGGDKRGEKRVNGCE